MDVSSLEKMSGVVSLLSLHKFKFQVGLDLTFITASQFQVGKAAC